jgi:hypothetical protein
VPAKTKNQHPSKDSESAKRPTLRHHVLSSGWVQNSVIGLIFIAVTLVAAVMTTTQIKLAAITFALTATAVAWIIAIVIIGYANEPRGLAFTINVSRLNTSHDPRQGEVWCRYNSMYGDTLSPASALLYVSAKNVESNPLFVQRLEVSLEKKGARRSPPLEIMPSDCKWYALLGSRENPFGDLKQARQFEISALDSQLHSSIGAGDTKIGWLVLSLTEAYPLQVGDEIRWHFRTTDSSGFRSVYDTPYTPVSDKDTYVTGSLQGGVLTVFGPIVDLSSLFIRINTQSSQRKTL